MSSPELRHLLYSVATGNPTAVDQSFFASLNEDDERVLDVDEGDARRVAGDSVMDDVADVDKVKAANTCYNALPPSTRPSQQR